MAMDAIPTVVVCLAIVLALFFNGFFIFVFIKRERLRNAETLPVNLLLVNLAIVDILAALLWSLHTALSAATGEWALGDGACKQQVFMMAFCQLINVHTLMILMFERFLHVFKPSKRQEIFFDVVVLLMLLAIYVFDVVIASFPFWGFGTPKYFSEQYQCAVDYAESVSHLKFTVAMHVGIPLCLILGFYIAVLIRIQVLKRKAGNGQLILLEDNLDFTGDSYSDRLKQQYLKFQGAGTSRVKPKIQEERPPNKDGLTDDTLEEEVSDAEADDKETGKPDSGEKKSKKARKEKKKTYYLSVSDMRQTHIYAIISAVYFTLWIPYMVRSIIWTYYFYDINISTTITMATVCLTHFGSCCKVPFYLLSFKIRFAVKKTLGIGQTDGTKKDYHVKQKSTKVEQTTEL